MAKRLVKTIPLENGLVLALYDASKKIAGDRWQVSCVASLAVPLDHPDGQCFSQSGISREELKAIFEDPVVFEKVLKRNFVDERELEQVVEGMFLSMTENLVPYLSRPEFPGRFLVRRYQEYQKEKAWKNMAG
jgi:hypothetical protein